MNSALRSDKKGPGVQVSSVSQAKARILKKYLEFAAPTNRALHKDTTLLRNNLLAVESSKNYQVLLAFRGRAARSSLSID